MSLQKGFAYNRYLFFFYIWHVCYVVNCCLLLVDGPDRQVEESVAAAAPPPNHPAFSPLEIRRTRTVAGYRNTCCSPFSLHFRCCGRRVFSSFVSFCFVVWCCLFMKTLHPGEEGRRAQEAYSQAGGQEPLRQGRRRCRGLDDGVDEAD